MKKQLFTVMLTLTLSIQTFASITSFDDITYWVGSGSNEAALVVDWHDQCLVWGYRWNGPATGEDMIRAIAAADSRFFMMAESGTSYGSALAGIGYDTGNDGVFSISRNGTTYTQNNFEDGNLSVSGYDYDGWTSVDDDDDWYSGWYEGYWSYWLNNSGKELDETTWGYSGVGMTGRTLNNGDWDGWSWVDFAGMGFGSAPANLEAAAVPEPVTILTVLMGGLLGFRSRRP
jgi:hypothetical protein